jgi:hypothetical protein
MDLPINYDKADWQTRKKARESYVELQSGKCHHCGEPLSSGPAIHVQWMSVNKRLFPRSFFKWPVHLHHNHSTGMTIGAVHNKCNAVLWQYHGE